MAKESTAKENPVVDALRRLKEEEVELLTKLKPLQEAIGALEKIVDKSVKKVKPSAGTKDGAAPASANKGTLVPDGDLFEAIRHDRVSVVTDQQQAVAGVPGFARKFVGESTQAITTCWVTGSPALTAPAPASAPATVPTL